MNLSYKNRISFYYMLITGLTMAAVFTGIYFVVKTSLYQHIDSDLWYEAKVHAEEVGVAHNEIIFMDKAEWEEREHVELQVHPVFVQITDTEGHLLDKSPNLKNGTLMLNLQKETNSAFNTHLNGKSIRQIQTAVTKDGVIKGYIITAMSIENISEVLSDLLNNLLLLFPLILLLVFVCSRILAGSSIRPVKRITATANTITKENLSQRIDLPKNKDELYSVTEAINSLLDRIEEAMQREKQFTSDASHQLRTPLAVLKGTLEVLIRRDRSIEEYQTKIISSIKEIDRISEIVDQLLLLARFNKADLLVEKQYFATATLIDDIVQRFRNQIAAKEICVTIEDEKQQQLTTSRYYLELILENIISNAIKYSTPKTKIVIRLFETEQRPCISVQDEGIGIAATDLEKVFHPFYRAAAIETGIKGNGLGLSIVKKASELLNVAVNIQSAPNKGTIVLLKFL